MSKGATHAEWDFFDLILGLTPDLLPVVSDPSVPISPNSRMKGVGKTPSVINKLGQAAGFLDWTSHVATDTDVAKWSKVPELGICLQTRNIRALDIDIDTAQAQTLLAIISTHLPDPPIRSRKNSNKLLVLFELHGDYQKRSFKTSDGLVEFLATGQQCIMAGTHTSGARYELNQFSSIPILTPAQFDALWAELTTYATETPTTLSTSKKEVLHAAIQSDPIAQFLTAHNWVHSTERDGRLHILCPNASLHTGESSESATTYFPANTGGYARGHFDCKHAHCAHLTDTDFLGLLGYEDLEFDDFSQDPPDTGATPASERFPLVHLADFTARPPTGYHIKGVLPHAEMAMLYGPPQSGKSFLALDMSMSIAQGLPWRELRVKQGRVVYIAAEGVGGLTNRINAYCEYHNTPRQAIDVFIMPAAPNFLNINDIRAITTTIAALHPALIVVDTWAQVTAGSDENSAKDMGKALSNAKKLHNATKATVLIIHHSGKDAEKGARGSSVFLGAAESMLEIRRNGDDRVMTTVKQKDGVEGLEFGFKLNVVKLGSDEDGDDITSCVVLAANVTTKEVNMGKNEKLLYTATLDSTGIDGLAPDTNTVLDNAASQLPYDEKIDRRDRRKDVVKQAYRKCIDKRVLFEVDGRVYVEEQNG